jgi:hypothetical protein
LFHPLKVSVGFFVVCHVQDVRGIIVHIMAHRTSDTA